MWWYELIDGGRDPNSREQNFGLFSGNQAAKPAACAMSQVGDLLTKYRPVSLRNTNGLWIAKFSSPGGNAFAAWTQTAGVTFNARIVAADPSGAAVLVKAICRDNGTTSPNSGTLSAAISNSPILFFTAAANLLVK
jgi:hypothetical protein